MPRVDRRPPSDKSGKVIVQSVLLPGDWSESRARKWLEDHDYIVGALVKEGNLWRARQYNPSDFQKGGVKGADFVTFTIPESGGVKLLRGRAK